MSIGKQTLIEAHGEFIYLRPSKKSNTAFIAKISSWCTVFVNSPKRLSRGKELRLLAL